jgi:hypothetical protein
MFHFCPQEAMMLLLMVPFMGGLIAWVRRKFKKHEKAEQEAHHPCCHPDDEHKEK